MRLWRKKSWQFLWTKPGLKIRTNHTNVQFLANLAQQVLVANSQLHCWAQSNNFLGVEKIDRYTDGWNAAISIGEQKLWFSGRKKNVFTFCLIRSINSQMYETFPKEFFSEWCFAYPKMFTNILMWEIQPTVLKKKLN